MVVVSSSTHALWYYWVWYCWNCDLRVRTFYVIRIVIYVQYVPTRPSVSTNVSVQVTWWSPNPTSTRINNNNTKKNNNKHQHQQSLLLILVIKWIIGGVGYIFCCINVLFASSLYIFCFEKFCCLETFSSFSSPTCTLHYTSLVPLWFPTPVHVHTCTTLGTNFKCSVTSLSIIHEKIVGVV